jgi:hypothetical protein
VHPRQVPNKREKVKSEHVKKLMKVLKNLPSNIQVNLPTDNFSIYEIFLISDLVLNQNSSSGLEASVFGIPTLVHDPKNFVAYDVNVGEKESENIVNALEALGYDSRNDAFFRQYTASAQVTGLNQGTIAVSPFSDEKALRIAGANDLLKEANEVVSGSSGQGSSRLIDAANKISNPLNNNKRVIGKNIKNAKSGLGGSPLTELYTANKKNIAVGALAIASLGVGYYMHKKNQERELYDETIAPQPTQSRSVQIAPFNNSYSLNGSRRTQMPLSTAGVVGNLDRQKIGHHQMGNNKYNHLYGG